MQGLARFSLVAVIVLAAILLGSWAYLTARYGSVEEFMASEDSPYWRPGSPSEAHDEPDSEEGRSLTERTADTVKAGNIPDDAGGGWRKAEPEKAPEEGIGKTADAAPQSTIEARIDTPFSDLAIQTEDETLTRNSIKSSLRPFFVRTRPNTSARSGYTDDRAYKLARVEGGVKSPELQELEKAGVVLIRGRVVENQKLQGLENVVVAAVLKKGEPSSLRAITNGNGEFVLYLSKEDAEACDATTREARLCIIADGMSPVAARTERLQITSEANSNGMHEIKLEKSRGLRVRVRVTNPRPIEESVRVWCELRDESGPTFDDHIFMSLIAPAQGDIVFRLPRGHIGQLRVGASGNGWAADAVETDKLSKDLVTVQVTLRPARSSLCQGIVCSNWYEDGAAGDGVAAARIAAVNTTDVTYAGEDGRFEFYARQQSEERLLRITTVQGFARTYNLEHRQKSDEERAMVRSSFDAKSQRYQWQLLAPLKVTTAVVLDAVVSSKRPMRLIALTQAAIVFTRSPDEQVSRLWSGGVPVAIDQREYSFKSVSWGARAFVLYAGESSSKLEPIATYTCEVNFWEDPDVNIIYPATRGRCTVIVRMPVMRN
ncbi:MAG: hypothetical protein IT461_00565 [Planctomycetes bacterium]|nr:hypothetical protein [Planctomycetota bacterium]